MASGSGPQTDVCDGLPAGTPQHNRTGAPPGLARAERPRERAPFLRDRKTTLQMATKAIVGHKVGMTQIWDENNRMIPVTVLEIEPLRVVQIRTPEKDGYSALQVTFGHKKASKLTNPGAGQYAKADVEPGERLVELRLDDVTGYEIGQEI